MMYPNAAKYRAMVKFLPVILAIIGLIADIISISAFLTPLQNSASNNQNPLQIIFNSNELRFVTLVYAWLILSGFLTLGSVRSKPIFSDKGWSNRISKSVIAVGIIVLPPFYLLFRKRSWSLSYIPPLSDLAQMLLILSVVQIGICLILLYTLPFLFNESGRTYK